jgi:hypothetical protein
MQIFYVISFWYFVANDPEQSEKLPRSVIRSRILNLPACRRATTSDLQISPGMYMLCDSSRTTIELLDEDDNISEKVTQNSIILTCYALLSLLQSKCKNTILYILKLSMVIRPKGYHLSPSPSQNKPAKSYH